MEGRRSELASVAGSAATFVFAVAIYIYQTVEGPIQSHWMSLVAAGIAAGLGISIFVSLLATPDSPAASASPGRASTSGTSRRGQIFRSAGKQAGPITAVILVVLVALVLSTIQVNTSYGFGPQGYDLTFGGAYPPCNFTIPLKGFGQMVFNWSEPLAYDGLSIQVSGPDYALIYSSLQSTPPIEGYAGLVLGPGVYHLLIAPEGSAQTTVHLTLEATYTSSGPLFSVPATRTIDVSTADCSASL